MASIFALQSLCNQERQLARSQERKQAHAGGTLMMLMVAASTMLALDSNPPAWPGHSLITLYPPLLKFMGSPRRPRGST